MAPDDLNLTVDFNDASFEDESSDDAYIPETWASNRNSTGDNASMAVLGAGSEAAEFVFDFDDASFDNDPDSDIGIESDMEGGSRVLRVDTSMIKVHLNSPVFQVIHIQLGQRLHHFTARLPIRVMQHLV